MKIAISMGTRPEFVKTWSVIKEIKRRISTPPILIHTGQHYDYEMSLAFFEDLEMPEPDYHLEVGSQSPLDQTVAIMNGVAKILDNESPDLLLVQGDTNSSMGSALAGVFQSVPIGHIEAGCRSYDRTMPEEINRIIIDSISSLLFAPSRIAQTNLLMEGHNPATVFLVGDTAADAILEALQYIEDPPKEFKKPYAIATIHRAENTNNVSNLSEILDALRSLPIKCYFAVHPRTQKTISEQGLKVESKSLEIIQPQRYLKFLGLLKHSQIVITDSGGVQKEAALLGKRTLTIRINTEWPDTIWEGQNRLVPPEKKKIESAVVDILSIETTEEHPKQYRTNAGRRIVDIIIEGQKKSLHLTNPRDMIKEGYPTMTLTKKKINEPVLSFSESGALSDIEEAQWFVVRDSRKLDD